MSKVLADHQLVYKTVAAFGLPGYEPAEALSIGEEEWSYALSTIRGDRITGLALACVEAGRLNLSDEQTSQLLEAQREAMLGPLAAERGLLELAPAFEEQGVEFLVLKGPSLAHTVYPDPSWRFFGDLDLLVRTRDWRRACDVLEGLGLRRDLPEPRRGFDERFGKACVYRTPSSLEVDLHRTLVLGPFGLWIEMDRLFQWTAEFQLGGQTLRRLDDTSLLLHACVHASLGWWPPLMVPVRDVAQIACFAQVDWHAFADRSARWKLGAVAQHALNHAPLTLGVVLPPETGAILTAPTRRKERRALRAQVTDRRNRGGAALSTLRAIPGISSKAAYVRALLFPDRDFLAARGGSSYLNRWRVAVRWLRLGRRRSGAV